jgi:hypothetical protein
MILQNEMGATGGTRPLQSVEYEVNMGVLSE